MRRDKHQPTPRNQWQNVKQNMPTLREAMSYMRKAKKDLASVPSGRRPLVFAKALAEMELLWDDNGSRSPAEHRLSAKELRTLQAWMNMYIIQAFQIEPSKVLQAFEALIEVGDDPDEGYWAGDAVAYARQYAQLLSVMLA